jgi:hypothetical protein
MMNVELSTQIRENYGAHEWDGKGECPQHWKSKGGEDWVITNAPSVEDAEHFVSAYIVGPHNDYFEEDVVSAVEVPYDHRTWLEGCTGEIDEHIRIDWADRFFRFPTIKS